MNAVGAPLYGADGLNGPHTSVGDPLWSADSVPRPKDRSCEDTCVKKKLLFVAVTIMRFCVFEAPSIISVLANRTHPARRLLIARGK